MVKKSTDKYLSLKIARLLMKAAGYWTASSKKERQILNGLLSYTIMAIASALWIGVCDFYYSIGDFYTMAYTACSLLPVVVILIKLATFMYHRKAILSLITFTEDNFWYAKHDEFDANILKDAERKGLMLISMFTFFVTATVVSYVLTPIIENIGKNESDRILPFNVWLGVPVALSPYFEIAFTMNVLALLHAGLCFCCFDNFLALLNIHVAAQFEILANRLKRIFLINDRRELCDYLENKPSHEELKECVMQHHTLIAYVDTLEHVFSYAVMGQLLVSSIMICVAGFQVFLSQGTFIRRLIFIAHTNGSFFQLFVITLTANEVLSQSSAIGEGAYSACWETCLYKTHQNVRVVILMIMLRSTRPCCITAGGFFPISVDTFISVMSTAFSYFTLLRKFDTDLDEK